MKKNKIKSYICGFLSGIFITSLANHYIDRFFKKEDISDINLKKEFSEPKFEESFKDTKAVAEYVIKDYYGQDIILRGEQIKVHSFDENGWKVEEAKKVEVPVENNEYLLDEYISENEAKVYNALKNKDDIKNQFYVYMLFQWMEEVYKEYIERKPFETLENRKEAVYKVCYDYIVLDEGYTIGGYEFSELEKAIQKDILKVFQNINYMRQNDSVKEESIFSKFVDRQGKVLKYELFKIGR